MESKLTTKQQEMEDEKLVKDMFKSFEKNHAFIQQDGMYICETTETTITYTYSQLESRYPHLICMKKGKPYLLVFLWGKINPNIRMYQRMDWFPPPLIAPSNIYNAWKPFYAQTLSGPYERDKVAFQRIRNYIAILCDKDAVVFNYVEKWIAQMLQFQATKTIAIVLVSQEGAGKGFFCNLIKRIIGDKKYLETTDMNKVAGKFNGLSKEAFFINLNEATSTQTKQLQSALKALITDTESIVENKGQDAVKFKNYSRVFITTNEAMPIKITKDNRRYLLIKSSNEKRKNKPYFKQLFNDILMDDNVIRYLYDFYTSKKYFPNMDKFSELPIPFTQYAHECMNAQKNPIYMFWRIPQNTN